MEKRLSFASYAKCLKEAMKHPYNGQLKITQLLFEYLIIPDEEKMEYYAYNKEGEPIFVDKVMASNLFNHKENVHASIQKNCDLDIVMNGISEYFEKSIVPKISPHLKNDLVSNLIQIVKSDMSIPEQNKREFSKKAENGDICEFLSTVFLYAVKKDNKTVNRKRERQLSGSNIQYYNSFTDNLFLHKSEKEKIIRLLDLYVMPQYKVISWEEESEPKESIIEYLSNFVKCDDREKGGILFIEGDAGVGKTSLVSYLVYQYAEQTKEWKKYFMDKNLLCIRLRDIIPTNMKFSSDMIVKDILAYLELKNMEDYKSAYDNTVIVLDGFDELCMVEGISANSQYYIYQIYDAFCTCGDKIIITTRPQYLNVGSLDISKKCIALLHFDASLRRQWINNYIKTGVLDYEKYGLEYISDEDNSEIDSICDTPMVLYMIVAGRINEEAKNNIWVLYHQIFYKELADTEYNSMFLNNEGIYSHGIKKHSDLIYRISSEIAYQMFCSGNQKLFLTEQEVDDIIDSMHIDNAKTKEIIQNCYALCNYWRANEKGAVEFYHNNIRDFFLCEKIFYKLNEIYQECRKKDDLDQQISYMNGQLYSFLRYMRLPQKVIEFLYLRTKYKIDRGIMNDFSAEERKERYLPYFFTDMLLYGGVSQYERKSNENIYSNMVCTLFNVVQIFRHIYEVFMFEGEGIIWWINKDNKVNDAEILKSHFKQIFISTPLTFEGSIVHLAGRSHFSSIVLDGIDLRYADFVESEFEQVDFSNSIISSASFEGCALKRCDFSYADLSYASFLGCKMEGCIFEGAVLVNTILPDGFQSADQLLQTEHIEGLNIDVKNK